MVAKEPIDILPLEKSDICVEYYESSIVSAIVF